MDRYVKRRIILFLIPCSLFLSPLHAQLPEMETGYKALAARFDGRDAALRKDLKAYLQAYPYTTYADEVRFMQAVLQVEKGNYRQSLTTFGHVHTKALTAAHQTEYAFYRGYAHMMVQEYREAAEYLEPLTKTDNRYTARSLYYNAYCRYQLGEYDSALPVFLKLEKDPQYAKTVPYFLTQIYYAQGNLDEVETRAPTLLREQPLNTSNAELHRILGEIFFNRQEYAKASEHLRKYEKAAAENGDVLVRTDMYMLGVSDYHLEQYDRAVMYLKKVKQQADPLSEAACLTLGNAYVELGQPEQALLSFQAAVAYGLTPSVTEEAAYNYTLCTYQASSALGESVRAFDDFLHRFPNSRYKDNIYRLYSDALLQSKDYSAALAALDSIDNPTPKMQQTKQYLRYQLGADQFLQGNMRQAVEWTSAVISHSDEDDTYTTEACYFRAEAEYRLRQYEAAEKDLARFFARPDAKKSENAGVARYLQGYVYFAQSRYEKAREAFSTYIDGAMESEAIYADALNRIGDCYFNARQFTQAITYYTQVSKLQAAGADYALFQRGYALGLQHNYAEKINVLRELSSRYPKSDFADDAVYETARAQLQRNDERGAIVTYEQLLNDYPHSTLARKASLERAMLYRNIGQTQQAMDAYRRTIETYPATEEAYTALEALQTLYVETDKVDEYLAYTKTLAKMNMNITTQEDSLLYAAAELQYMQASYKKAIVSLGNYLQQYCAGGRYCTSARYYLADAYYRLGNTTEALAQYRMLADISANPYQEEAATRVAEICFDQSDYEGALDAFYLMLSLASGRENAMVARLGILRCSQALNRWQNVIDIADQILSDTPVDEETKAEALYARAKAHVTLGEWKQAQPDLKALAAEVRTARGAEAEYLLAQSHYELNDLDAAEAEVSAFLQMNTRQQYWLARGLILLSDVNRDRKDLFQARQYLLVLQQNYTIQGDDIPALISARMAQLDELEKPEVKKEVDDED